MFLTLLDAPALPSLGRGGFLFMRALDGPVLRVPVPDSGETPRQPSGAGGRLASTWRREPSGALVCDWHLTSNLTDPV